VLLDAGRVVAAGDLASISRVPQLAQVLGRAATGAVVRGAVTAFDLATGVARLRVGNGDLAAVAQPMPVGHPVQLQVLADDVIVALEPPRGLSVRNALAAKIVAIRVEDLQATLIDLDVGRGALLQARITAQAAQELSLAVDQPVWALIKTVSLRDHVFPLSSAR
jgi:molybdate transport system ATP-binding protein